MAPAAVRIREILNVAGIDEVMIGLNDLRLQMGVANHFEMLASPLVDMLADEVHRKGLPLAVGGVGRVGDRSMPVPPDLVACLISPAGGDGAWLARSIYKPSATWAGFTSDCSPSNRISEWAAASPQDLETAHAELARHAVLWRDRSLRPRSAIA